MKIKIGLLALILLAMAVSYVYADLITLKFTAVADDDNIAESGPADHYVMKYATYTITAENFDSVQDTIATGTPKNMGEEETIGIDLPQGYHYWFALKVYDEVGNKSDISNIVEKDFFPPSSPILSLQ